MARLAESGALQYAVENNNLVVDVSRLGASGYISGAYKDFMQWSSYNVGVEPACLSARGHLYHSFYKELSSYGYNCIAGGDFFSTPDSADASITGNITIVVDVALDDWTPTSTNALVAKDTLSAGTRSYLFNVTSTGALRFYFSINGTAAVAVTSDALSFVDGTRQHVAVERESVTGKVRFYTSIDGQTWVMHGVEQTSTTGAIFDSPTIVQFGNVAASSLLLAGKVFDSEIYAGLKISDSANAVMKVDFDPTDWVSGATWTSADTGEVWTINGNALVNRT